MTQSRVGMNGVILRRGVASSPIRSYLGLHVWADDLLGVEYAPLVTEEIRRRIAV